MRVLIAEDEPHLADDLARRLTRLWPELRVVGVVADGIAARHALLDLAPDIAFLDIRMPGLSGLEAARAAPPGCRVVFVTAYDEHAVAAFDQAAADYLLKPVADARLARCLERLRQPAADSGAALLTRLRDLLDAPQGGHLRWLRAQVGEDVRLLAVDDVCFLQAADKYTRVVTRDAEYLLRTPLKELAAGLDPELFWRVHRGCLVNARQIVAARRDLLGRLRLSLRDHAEVIPVSRAHAHLFKQM
jgi:DNA-binding LytR/AlgR family response regulator